jgi:hypothetical protein
MKDLFEIEAEKGTAVFPRSSSCYYLDRLNSRDGSGTDLEGENWVDLGGVA